MKSYDRKHAAFQLAHEAVKIAQYESGTPIATMLALGASQRAERIAHDLTESLRKRLAAIRPVDD